LSAWSGGEDGSIQGVLEYLKIPYSGSGVMSSALGMDKALQRQWMKSYGYATPDYITLKRNDISDSTLKKIHAQLKKKIGIPCVIKPSHQVHPLVLRYLPNPIMLLFRKPFSEAFLCKKLRMRSGSHLPKSIKFPLYGNVRYP